VAVAAMMEAVTVVDGDGGRLVAFCVFVFETVARGGAWRIAWWLYGSSRGDGA